MAKNESSRFGAESVTFWRGTGRDIATYLSRFVWSYGSPNITSGINGIACYAPRVFGATATSGSFWVGDYSQQFADRYDNPKWKAPQTIVIWGNNPLISNSDGLYGHWIVDCMKRGSELITIDPKCTWLASKSKLWLQIRPGTDTALAMGIANVMIEEKLYDEEFVDLWCYGFEEFSKRVAPFTAAETAKITWIPEEDIRKAAHIMARSDGMALQWGVAVDQTTEALPACQALSSLIMITGNLDNPGGMIRPPELLQYLGGWGHEFLPAEQEEKRLGLEDYPFYRTGVVSAAAKNVMETIETGKPYPLKAAYEGECKSDMEILLELGRRLSPEAWPWKTTEEMYSHILESTGLDFDQMQEAAPVYLPYEYYKYKSGALRKDGQPGFNTATGRVELYSLWYDKLGLDPLPQFYEPTPSPYSTPELYKEYPSILVTGPRMWGYFHSENRRQEHLRADYHRPVHTVH